MSVENLNEVIENVSVDDLLDAATDLTTSTNLITGGVGKDAWKYTAAVAGGIAVGVVTCEVVIPKVKEMYTESKDKKKKRKDKDEDIVDVEAVEVTEDETEEETDKKDKKKSKKK